MRRHTRRLRAPVHSIDWSVNRVRLGGGEHARGGRPTRRRLGPASQPRQRRTARAAGGCRRRLARCAAGALRPARGRRRLRARRPAARRSDRRADALARSRARHRPRGWVGDRAPPGPRQDVEHLAPHRPGRGGPRRLPEDPPLRRDCGRAGLPGVQLERAGRRARGLGGGRRNPARPDGLLRPPLSRAVPDPRSPRRPGGHRAGELHADHGRRALGGPAARPRDREPGLRGRPGTGGRVAAGDARLRQQHDRGPVGRGARPRAGRRRALRGRGPRLRPPGRGARAPAEPGQPRAGGVPLAPGGDDIVVSPARAGGVDKRRLILDAAIRVFARRGFHHCRVSDVADEAGVAYGLVYHYFGSKEEILNQVFSERWQLMLDAIAEIDRQEVPARDKLYMVASFIIDSYHHEPDLMKVIIVEVTRAANTFGREHLEKIREAYGMIAAIVETARADGSFKEDISAEFAAMCFYGAIEQLLSGWIFGYLSTTDEEFERAKSLVVETICGGLEQSSAGTPTISG